MGMGSREGLGRKREEKGREAWRTSERKHITGEESPSRERPLEELSLRTQAVAFGHLLARKGLYKKSHSS